MYARNCFDLVTGALNLNLNLNQRVALREAVKELSVGGGQGFLKCNCTAACLTATCTFTKNLFCTTLDTMEEILAIKTNKL